MPARVTIAHAVLAGLFLACTHLSLCGQENSNLLVPTSPTPIYPKSDGAGTSIHGSAAPVCTCPSDGPRWHSPWTWFRQKPKDRAAAYCEGGRSGCNIHPEPPFGASYHAFQQMQIAKGEAALMVLHHYDFEWDQADLNYRGRQRLRTIAERSYRLGIPIIVEASRDDPQLDIARLAHVISALPNLPFALDERHVVIGPALTRGLDGLDAEIIHENLLQQTRAGGQSATAITGPGMSVPVAR